MSVTIQHCVSEVLLGVLFLSKSGKAFFRVFAPRPPATRQQRLMVHKWESVGLPSHLWDRRECVATFTWRTVHSHTCHDTIPKRCFPPIWSILSLPTNVPPLAQHSRLTFVAKLVILHPERRQRRKSASLRKQREVKKNVFFSFRLREWTLTQHSLTYTTSNSVVLSDSSGWCDVPCFNGHFHEQKQKLHFLSHSLTFHPPNCVWNPSINSKDSMKLPDVHGQPTNFGSLLESWDVRLGLLLVWRFCEVHR